MSSSAQIRTSSKCFANGLFGSLLMVLVMLAVSVPVARAQGLPRAPQAQVFTLTPEPGFFTEPSVAVDPHNPQHVVVAYQDNAHVSYSFDTGRTWTPGPDVAPSNYRVSGDVSIAYDNQGRAFLCYMAFDKLGTMNYWAHGAMRSGVFVRRSLDGGKTWEANHVPIIEHPTVPGIPFEDKPYIVADSGPGPHAGNLYVGWTRWTLVDSEILFSRSTDGGAHWSPPIEIDNYPGLPRDDNGANEGFDGAVGPDSTLYAVWAEDGHIVLTTSRDGGATFDAARPIIDTAPIMFKIEDVDRSNGFPQIAIDPRNGWLYVTWSDYRNGDVDVFSSTSADHGKTWSAPARVNSDELHDGADQFFQWLAVDPTDGAAYVVFYDRRQDPANRAQTVVLARSTDGGHSFVNCAWTNTPFSDDNVFMGDYSALAAYGGRVYGAWTEKPVLPENEKAKSEKPKNQTEYWKTHGTIVRLGVADFSSAGTAATQ